MAYESAPLIDALSTAERGALAALLAEDVVFHSPVATYRGAPEVLRVLGTVADVLDEIRVVRELPDGEDGAVTFVAGRIGEHELDGVLVQRGSGDGHIAELTLTLRPLEGLLAGVREMARRLA